MQLDAPLAQPQTLFTPFDQFFKPVHINSAFVFCGDERQPLYARLFIHIFGGLAFQAYNLAIMNELQTAGSVKTTFEDLVVEQITGLNAAGIRAGVHSDYETEHGKVIDTHELAGGFGCGYIAKRAAISELIANQTERMVAQAMSLRPELFSSSKANQQAAAVFEAQRRLATRPGFLTAGRSIGLKAIQHGAPAMVVSGRHLAKEGIINLVTNTTLDSAAANKAGKPVYNHDQWAVMEMFDRSTVHYDRQVYDMATTIDAIGTLLALGVETIAVRR